VIEPIHVSLTRLRELSKEAIVTDEKESAHIHACLECNYLLNAFALHEAAEREKNCDSGEDLSKAA